MASLHFETVSDSLAELPPEDRAVAEDLYVQQTGVLPTAIKNALLGGLLSSDPAAQMAAAQRLVKLGDPDAALRGVQSEIAGNGAKPRCSPGAEDTLHAIVRGRHGPSGGYRRASGAPDGVKTDRQKRGPGRALAG